MRSLFDKELVTVIQGDAMIRCNLKQLIFEPELLENLEQDIRRTVTAAINRRRHSPIPSAAAMDYRTTISRNLNHYSQELHTIVPEHFYFFDRTSTTAANKWTVILDIDQSGSMGESVIYLHHQLHPGQHVKPVHQNRRF